MTTQTQRLEEIRTEIRAERISYGELFELQNMTEFIEPDDVELLEWAGVPEGITGQEWARMSAEEREATETK